MNGLPWQWSVVSFLVRCEVIEPEPSKPMGPRLYPVRGTVTLEGKPLGDAVVVSMPAVSDAGTHNVGETKKSSEPAAAKARP
jgi:hypothetical protein